MKRTENSFWQTDKNVARFFGYKEAAFIAEILWRQKMYSKKEMIENGFIYSSREHLEKQLFLPPAKQRSITNKLIKFGILEVRKIGMPPINYYKINEEKLNEVSNYDHDKMYENWKARNKKNTDKKFGKKRYVASRKQR